MKDKPSDNSCISVPCISIIEASLLGTAGKCPFCRKSGVEDANGDPNLDAHSANCIVVCAKFIMDEVDKNEIN